MPRYVKKYELTSQRMTLRKGVVLRRIRALRDFACVRKGDLGGWVQSERNLGTDYNLAWVAGEAKVYGKACVTGDAWVSGNAQVYGEALVKDEATVYENAQICGRSVVADCANVCENAMVHGDAQVMGNAKVSGKAQIFGNAVVANCAIARENAKIYGNAEVHGNIQAFENAEICGEAVMRCKALIGGEVKIEKTTDYVSIMPVWTGEGMLTLTRCGMAFSAYFSMGWDELWDECAKMPKQHRNQFRKIIKFAKMFFRDCDLAKAKKKGGLYVK